MMGCGEFAMAMLVAMRAERVWKTLQSGERALNHRGKRSR
jgi:hypothetical protein